MDQKEKLNYILKTVFKHDGFKALQYEPIECLTQQHPHDVICVFPTSAGKSLVYQLPTIYNNKITIIISPLLSLMQDQINKLKELNLNAFSYSSDETVNSKSDLINIINSCSVEIHYIFTTPESLINQQFKSLIQKISTKIGLVCIDECHVIVEWGKSFRRSYRNLNVIRDELLPKSVPILALTASTTYYSAKQIISQLHLENFKLFIQSFNRKNIFYSVYHKQGQIKKEHILNQLLTKYYYIDSHKSKSAIIYTSTRQEAENLEQLLNTQDFQCFFYHAGLSNEQKSVLLKQWSNDQIQIIIATIAFAMGIDKANVGLVVHFCLPKSVEGFYQESGRAGRNGEDSYSVVLVDPADVNFRTSNIQREDKYDQLSYYYLLKILYCNGCRRKVMLQYFNSGIEFTKQVNCCDFCQSKNLFSQVFGHQGDSFSGLVEGIESQISNLESQCVRKQLVELQNEGQSSLKDDETEIQMTPIQQDNDQQEQNQQVTQQQVNTKNNNQNGTETIEQIKHDVKKQIIIACKKKMGQFVVTDLNEKVDLLVQNIITKAQTINQIEKIRLCGDKVAQYIKGQIGAFSYNSLQMQATKFFM